VQSQDLCLQFLFANIQEYFNLTLYSVKCRGSILCQNLCFCFEERFEVFEKTLTKFEKTFIIPKGLVQKKLNEIAKQNSSLTEIFFCIVVGSNPAPV
jgi:hypothetical protein